jgi:hypothetical protein
MGYLYQLSAAPTAVTQAAPVQMTKQCSLLPAPLSEMMRSVPAAVLAAAGRLAVVTTGTWKPLVAVTGPEKVVFAMIFTSQAS